MDHKATLSDLQREFDTTSAKPPEASSPPRIPAPVPIAHEPNVSSSPEINEIAKALAAAQAEMGHAKKGNENLHFKSRYADLAAVWDAIDDKLAKNGIAVSQFPSASGNLVTVETRFMHTSGQWLTSRLTLLCADTRPQTIGSGITYARRYALSAMAGIAPDDDDGNAASGRAEQQRPPAKRTISNAGDKPPF